MALPKVNDWSAFRNALKLLAETFPDRFDEWVLIGGGACWFYRTMLERWADPDFPPPQFSPAEESEWLSKDIDFMGETEEEAEKLLAAPIKVESHTISYRGLEVDFLQEGVRLLTKDAIRSAREVRTPDLTFRVLDAALLYTEKLAVFCLKPRPQDRLHLRVLEAFLKCEFCRELEVPETLDAVDWVDRVREVKTADHDFFVRDARLQARLRNALPKLTAREHARVHHWGQTPSARF